MESESAFGVWLQVFRRKLFDPTVDYVSTEPFTSSKPQLVLKELIPNKQIDHNFSLIACNNSAAIRAQGFSSEFQYNHTEKQPLVKTRSQGLEIN